MVVYTNRNMIDMDLLRGIVLTLDYLQWINFKFKKEKFQISPKEFTNEDIGKSVELGPHV